jgi:DNA-binding response OmpR family regulator
MKLFLKDFDPIDRQIVEKVLSDFFDKESIICEVEEADSTIFLSEIGKKPWKIGFFLDLLENKLNSINKNKDLSYKHYGFLSNKGIFIISGKEIKLNEREADLVYLLIEAKDKGCLRDYLLENIWGYRPDLETHVVETQIYRLRQKIESVTGRTDVIITMDGGYRLD